MIAIVTDSNSQLPPELAERYGIEIVPLTVTVDGVAYLEGVDLDADAFYARFSEGDIPAVATAQPSPGRFTEVYERATGEGATEILSIHIGSNLSGTVNSARLAAELSSVPVRIVDTGTASFAISCCVWEAAEAIAAGASLEEAAAAAEGVAKTVGNVFVVKALDIARSGGRLAQEAQTIETNAVLTLGPGGMEAIGQVRTLDEAAETMAAYVLGAGVVSPLRVGVGVADEAALPLVEALEGRLRGQAGIMDLVRYRIGPSVGAHTGPGTVGTMFYPVIS